MSTASKVHSKVLIEKGWSFFNFPSCSRWHISLVIRKDMLGGSEMKSVNQSIIVR